MGQWKYGCCWDRGVTREYLPNLLQAPSSIILSTLQEEEEDLDQEEGMRSWKHNIVLIGMLSYTGNVSLLKNNMAIKITFP